MKFNDFFGLVSMFAFYEIFLSIYQISFITSHVTDLFCSACEYLRHLGLYCSDLQYQPWESWKLFALTNQQSLIVSVMNFDIYFEMPLPGPIVDKLTLIVLLLQLRIWITADIKAALLNFVLLYVNLKGEIHSFIWKKIS